MAGMVCLPKRIGNNEPTGDAHLFSSIADMVDLNLLEPAKETNVCTVCHDGCLLERLSVL
jgi:hypothetical protein